MAITGRRPPGVPPTLERAAAVSWRLLLVGFTVLAVVWLLRQVMVVVIPVIVALMATTVLLPPARWLDHHGVPRLLATWLVFLGGLGVVAGVLLLIVPQLVDQFSELGQSLQQGFDRVRDWLANGPLGLSRQQVEQFQDRIVEELQGRSGAIAGGVARGAVMAIEIVAGILLTAVLVFFFVKDAEKVTDWSLRRLSEERREPVRRMGAAAWGALAGYIRGTAVVGVVDAVLIGAGLVVIGVPLVIPLAVLTFAGAFFPLVGATVAGLAAALVALVSNGLGDALLVLAVVIVVQQVEGDVLAPLVVGRAVHLHPVVVLLALTAGGVLAGLVGAFLAVPVAAVVVAVTAEWRRGHHPSPAGEQEAA